jgi:hypothetical protein
MFFQLFGRDIQVEHCTKGLGVYRDGADTHIIVGTTRIIVSRKPVEDL